MSESNYMEQVEPVLDIGPQMIVKHTGSIFEQPAGRTRDIAGIYIESENGERFGIPRNILMVQEQWQDTLLKVVTQMIL